MSIHRNPKEERVNYLSHGAGVLLGIVVGVLFLVNTIGQHHHWATVGVSLYLFGMLGSYAASTLYHAWSASSPWKERLRKWDHAAIYWHIAGSYSPITLVALRSYGYWGWSLFVFVWMCAIVGTVMSLRRLREHSYFETVCFVLMGLSVLVPFKALLACVPAHAIGWLIAEGVCYITGAVFYSFHKIPYMHPVFHFFVLMGSVCHIICVWDFL